MRILFFMGTGARTGSELALYNYIRHAAACGWELAVACEGEGELLGEMPAGAPTFVYGYGAQGLGRRAYEGLRRSVSKVEDLLSVSAIHRKFRPDAWYVNTCIQPRLVAQARRNRIPCVLHTHELEQMLGRVTEAEARLLVEYPLLVVASSRAARDVFLTLGRKSALELCYAGVDLSAVRADESRAREVRRSLGAGERTFVWAMSGTLDPNKNPVRFAEVAAEMLGAGHDARFLWVGGGGSGYALYAAERARALGVADRLTWAGERRADYYDYLNAADGLVLTSYRESLSLVSVEAARLSKPVVSFDNGGVREVVGPGTGVVVESWNNSDLIAAMLRVMRGEAGFDAAAARARASEFDAAALGPRWERVVREHVEGALARGG
jgi:glycosyltransferase involved in cell wall biosynthesis